jgi:hypothetical protein
MVQSLLNVLAVVGLTIALWVLISGPAHLIKSTLDALGLSSFPGRIVEVIRRVGFIGDVMDRFFERARASLAVSDESVSATLVLDQRHKEIGAALRSAEAAINAACSDVAGFSGTDGKSGLGKLVRELKESTKFAADLGGEIDIEQLKKQYGERTRAWGNFIFGAFLATAFALANGTLLSIFLRDWIPGRIFGMPVAWFPALVIVAMELGVGYALALATKRKAPVERNAIILAAAFGCVMFAWIEGFIFAVLGASMELSDILPFLAEGGAWTGWMAPLGVGFVLLTSTMGFLVHTVWDDLAEHLGDARLSKEVRQANRFVNGLPDRWSKIDQSAQRAASSVENYQSRLSAQGGALKGVIAQIRSEGDRLRKALEDARIDDWTQAVVGSPGDVRQSRAFNVIIFLATAFGLTAFTAALATAIIGAIEVDLPIWAAALAALAGALGYYAIGFMCFDRIQIAKADGGGPARVIPLRAGVPQTAAAIVIGSGVSLGAIWACAQALGPWGIVAGVGLACGGGLLAILGYHCDRAARGAMLIASVGVACIAALASALFGALRFIVLWLLAAMAWIVSAALSVLAAPVAQLLKYLRERRERELSVQPANNDVPAASAPAPMDDPNCPTAVPQ